VPEAAWQQVRRRGARRGTTSCCTDRSSPVSGWLRRHGSRRCARLGQAPRSWCSFEQVGADGSVARPTVVDDGVARSSGCRRPRGDARRASVSLTMRGPHPLGSVTQHIDKRVAHRYGGGVRRLVGASFRHRRGARAAGFDFVFTHGLCTFGDLHAPPPRPARRRRSRPGLRGWRCGSPSPTAARRRNGQ